MKARDVILGWQVSDHMEITKSSVRRELLFSVQTHRAWVLCGEPCSPCAGAEGRCFAGQSSSAAGKKRRGKMLPRCCCSVRDKAVPLLSLAGFVSTAIESLMITFSPTWSYFSSCSAASPWQLRTLCDTSPLGTKYAPHPPSLTGCCKHTMPRGQERQRRLCQRLWECLSFMVSEFVGCVWNH